MDIRYLQTVTGRRLSLCLLIVFMVVFLNGCLQPDVSNTWKRDSEWSPSSGRYGNKQIDNIGSNESLNTPGHANSDGYVDWLESPTPAKTNYQEVTRETSAPFDISTLAGKYTALVIGNNQYTYLDHLLTAENDAKEVGRILEQDYGYKVDLLLNATREQIYKVLETYRKNLSADENLLIYYAGHGWLDQGGDEGYWLPVDAAPDSAINWISNSNITTILKTISAKHVMVVADSCYSGKLVRGIRIQQKTPHYLAEIAGKRSRTVLASGGLEPVDDGGGENGHSVFATAFLNALRVNDAVIDGTDLFNMIRRPVMLNSNQIPQYADLRKAGHDGGDFLFFKPAR